MAVEAKAQPTEPPEPLRTRRAFVQFNNMNTVVIPHDLKDSSSARWFAKQVEPATQPVPPQRAGNEVVFFLDGKETFEQFCFEIQHTNGENDFIYLVGWILFLDFDLGGSTMRELLTSAARRKVQIRVMLPENAGGFGETFLNTFLAGNNTGVTRWISTTLAPYGAAILDGRTLLEGTHHQKILIVKHADQLTAFCGGVDINPDRVQATGHGAPLHDLHCRIRGPAAWDLLQTFIQRWTDYVEHFSHDSVNPSTGQKKYQPWLLDLKPLAGKTCVPPAATGNLAVQIVRTYGNAPTFSYDFAPKGERSVMSLIAAAIMASQRFIYLEDQYLVNMYLAELLKKQLAQIKHLTILVPPGSVSDLPEGVYRRKMFIDKVKEGGVDKVRVFCLSKPGPTCGTYVHAKTWIFDDKFAIIGSANCNRRGLTHDSEVAAGIFDASDDTKLTYCFAHRLRIKLWAHHLGLDDPEGEAELADGVASADNWFSAFRPANARIEDYHENEGVERLHSDYTWNHSYDPDGS